MSGRLKEHIATRRRVRQAKKIAAVDQNRGKRKLVAWLLFVLLIIFVVAEGAGVYLARKEYERQHAAELESDIISNLAIMSAALQTGNQALFEQNFNAYRTDLARLNKNNYARQNSADKLAKLNDYEKVINDDAGVILELNQLHSMLNQLSLIASTNDIVEDLTSYRQNLIKLEENVNSIKAEQLKEIKTELLALTVELESQLESIAICVNVCPSSTFDSKRDFLKTTITDAIAKLNGMNDKLVERYSPHQYILLLQ